MVDNQPLLGHGMADDGMVARSLALPAAGQDRSPVGPGPGGGSRCSVVDGVGGAVPTATAVGEGIDPLANMQEGILSTISNLLPTRVSVQFSITD